MAKSIQAATVNEQWVSVSGETAARSLVRLIEAEGGAAKAERVKGKWGVRERVDRTPVKLRSKFMKENPESSAADMYESFHGEPSQELLEFEETHHFHENLAALGVLVEIRVAPITGGKDVNICFDGAGEVVENPLMKNGLILSQSLDKKEWSFTLDGKYYGPYKSVKSRDVAYHEELDKKYGPVKRVGTVHKEKEAGKRFVEKYRMSPAMANPYTQSFTGKAKGSSSTFTFHPIPADLSNSTLGVKVKKFIAQHPEAVYWSMTPLRGGTAMVTLFDGQRGLVAQQDTAHINPGKKGPGPIGQATHLVSQVTGTVRKPMDQFLGQVGKVGGYLDGLMANPRSAYYVVGKDGNDRLASVKAGPYRTKALGKNSGAFNYGDWVLPYKQVEKLEKQGLLKMDGVEWRGWRKENPGPSTVPTFLCSNEHGTQIYCVGGDQALDLAQLKITGPAADKELITIGTLTHITYHTRKIFDGKQEEYDYIHKMGEKGGFPPDLIYDRLNKKLLVAGGSYKIEKPWFQTSPGIEN